MLRADMCRKGLGHFRLVSGQISELTGWTLGQPLPQSYCHQRWWKMKGPHPCDGFCPSPSLLLWDNFVKETVAERVGLEELWSFSPHPTVPGAVILPLEIQSFQTAHTHERVKRQLRPL